MARAALRQAQLFEGPVHRCELLIKRRKGERAVAIDWHLAARPIERPAPAACPRCRRTRH